MVVSELDRGRDAINARPHDTEGVTSMLNQSTTFGDARLSERFWKKVRVLDDGCWEWTSSTTHDGYGRFRVGSRRDDTEKVVSAHRWSYEKLIGPIPIPLSLDHLCRNRACVYPAHLEAVTIRENILRGNGLAACQARRTHCPYGHPYSGDNLYLKRNGARQCRECWKRYE